MKQQQQQQQQQEQQVYQCLVFGLIAKNAKHVT
jgi:hypothetical protein